MPKQYALIPLTALALLAMGACRDGQISSAPKSLPPTAPSQVLGLLQVTVDGTTMSTNFIPVGASPGAYDPTNFAMYGTQNTTVNVTGVVDSLHDVAGNSRTWFTHVRIRNLLNRAIGSNYSKNNAAPPDTTGVFVFFSGNIVVKIPTPCAGCAVSVNNPAGSANFTNPNQKYFWYRNRPTAVQGSPGTDTTDNMVWLFKTSTFTAPDTVHAFTFTIELSADQPPDASGGGPSDNSWTYKYNGTTDSLPDTQAEPRWRIFQAPSTQVLGTDSWTAGTELVTNGGLLTSVYLSRHDSMGTNPAQNMNKANLKVTARATVAGTDYQAVFGLVETGGKQVFVGIYGTGVSFVTFDELTGTWSLLGTACVGCLSTTTYRNYTLKKFFRDSVVLCQGSTYAASLLYSSLQAATASFANKTVVFGTPAAVGAVQGRWTSVAPTIGLYGGSGCP